MAKTIKVSESQLGLFQGIESFVVTGVKADSFNIAHDDKLFTIEGKLTGLKVADTVLLKNGELAVKGAAPTEKKKHNPSPEVMAEFGIR